MQKKIAFAFFSLSLIMLPVVASAGRTMCGKEEVSRSVRRCPDGSIPVFVADEVKPSTPDQTSQDTALPGQGREQQRTAEAKPADPKPADVSFYYGVWRTRIPGAVWTSPSGYAGYDWLHVSAGVSVGDLIIRPDGTYLWNSYGGKSGKWVRGDSSYPVVLIDNVEHREWKVGADGRHIGGRDIVIWDGKFSSYDGRR